MRDLVSISAVESAAKANNRPGPDHMNCGESVIAALWDAFEPDFPRSVVSMGAGMGKGVGGSGCICGALAGGVLFALGIIGAIFYSRRMKQNGEVPFEITHRL